MTGRLVGSGGCAETEEGVTSDTEAEIGRTKKRRVEVEDELNDDDFLGDWNCSCREGKPKEEDEAIGYQ